MGMGRIGNFIDGQIVGSVTTVWWGVQFPDAPGAFVIQWFFTTAQRIS